MKTKKCSKCLLTLNITNFYDKQGKCKKCRKKQQTCEHNRRKSECKECKGGSICEHNNRRICCKECKGGSICEHKRIRSKCKECDGSQICEHKRIREQCKECDGSQICEHNRRKSDCKECDGSQICEHKRIRATCNLCNGCAMCIHCKMIRGKKRHVESLNKKILCCIRCFYRFYPNDKIPRRYKMKQHYFNEKLIEEFGVNFFQYDKKIKCGCSGRMPDWFIDCFKYSIIIELDEDQHKYISCDEKRMMELFQDLGNRNLVLIRINPDKYKQGEEKIKGCFRFNRKNTIICNNNEFDTRFNLLIQKIKYYMDNQPTKELTIERLFFDL